MGAERQTNIHTNIHKHRHTIFGKQFQETKSVPTAGLRTPGLKISWLDMQGSIRDVFIGWLVGDGLAGVVT